MSSTTNMCWPIPRRRPTRITPSIEAIIAHEYFHNWTGNRITCRDWFQLCLKEGLTVYRDHAFSADSARRPVKRIAEIRLLKAHQFPEDAGPLAHPVRPESYREINNFYTATVYEKGSEVVRMIRTILGAEDFRKGMDLYFERHDGDAATIEDFLACFAEASGRDLKQFALWYSQAGTPSVSVSSDWNETKKTFKVTLEQSLAPTPGQAAQGADAHSARLWPDPARRHLSLTGQPAGGEASGRRVPPHQAQADLQLLRCSGPPGAVDQSRFFRAGQHRHGTKPRGSRPYLAL
jgi:aminopeptidase N